MSDFVHGYMVFKDKSKPTPEFVEKYRKLIYDIRDMIEKKYGVKVRVKESVIEAVIARWENDGLPYCPCKPISSKYTICPCVEIPDVLLKKGRCTCGLFIIG